MNSKVIVCPRGPAEFGTSKDEYQALLRAEFVMTYDSATLRSVVILKNRYGAVGACQPELTWHEALSEWLVSETRALQHCKKQVGLGYRQQTADPPEPVFVFPGERLKCDAPRRLQELEDDEDPGAFN
jgi:hypothetical protein